MPRLLILSTRQKGTKLTLQPGKEFVVGRHESCHIRIAAGGVSRRHCLLRATDAGLWVRDLGSRNGTFVNEVRIEGERLLTPGDLLTLGEFAFQVLPDPVPKPPAVAAHTAEPALEGLTSTQADADTAEIPVAPESARPEPAPAPKPAYRHITFRKEISVAIVHPGAKRITAQEFEAVLQDVSALVEHERCPQVLLDLSGVQYLHSMALVRLLTFHNEMKSRGGQLKLCGIQPVVRELFETTQFNKLLDVYEDEPSALEAFN